PSAFAALSSSHISRLTSKYYSLPLSFNFSIWFIRYSNLITGCEFCFSRIPLPLRLFVWLWMPDLGMRRFGRLERLTVLSRCYSSVRYAGAPLRYYTDWNP